MRFPRSWKEIEALERHPLSELYPDIIGAARERMLATLKDHGIANNRKVTLHEGKVLDGWQFLKLCIEAKRKPSFQEVTLGWNAEEFVEVVNDHRRHESQEMMAARAAERRERVAAARVEGKSNRAIAADEEVSETTIRNDAKALRAKGTHAEPPNGKITDSSGRKQLATKSKKPKNDKPSTLKQTAAESNVELKDELDNPAPPGLRSVFEDAAVFRGVLSQLREIKAALNKLYNRPAGQHLHKQEVEMALDNARRSVRFGMPYAVCPVCSGIAKARKPDCPCKNSGWLPEDNYNVLPLEYRQ